MSRAYFGRHELEGPGLGSHVGALFTLHPGTAEVRQLHRVGSAENQVVGLQVSARSQARRGAKVRASLQTHDPGSVSESSTPKFSSLNTAATKSQTTSFGPFDSHEHWLGVRCKSAGGEPDTPAAMISKNRLLLR